MFLFYVLKHTHGNYRWNHYCRLLSSTQPKFLVSHGPPTWSTWSMQSPLTSFYRTNGIQIHESMIQQFVAENSRNIVADHWSVETAITTLHGKNNWRRENSQVIKKIKFSVTMTWLSPLTVSVNFVTLTIYQASELVLIIVNTVITLTTLTPRSSRLRRST